MNKKIRIALVADSVFPFVIGGMQKHTFNLIKQFLLREIDLTLFHYVFDKDVNSQHIKKTLSAELNIPINNNLKVFTYSFHSIDYNSIGHYVLKSYNFSKIVHKDLIKEKPFDFIYAKGLSSWFSLTHKNELPPIGVQLHGLEMFQPSFTFKSRLEHIMLKIPAKIILKKADYIFTYGGKVKKILHDLKISNSKMQIQYGGVENSNIIDAEKLNQESPKIRFLFIGRNTRRKGYYELKKAINRLSSNLNIEFGFIGPINEKDKINKGWVKYFGEIKNTIDYYNIIDKHDVLIITSISEGFPTIIPECMSRGLTVLATDVGAITDIVNPNNGIIISPNNVDSIKNGIEEFINLKPNELMLKKKNALMHVKNNFTWEYLGDCLIKFIENAIK